MNLWVDVRILHVRKNGFVVTSASPVEFDPFMCRAPIFRICQIRNFMFGKEANCARVFTPRTTKYSSDNKELSITDKQKICEILKTPFESAWFAPTKESIVTVWLPEKPTFTTQEGRKFWLLSGNFHP